MAKKITGKPTRTILFGTLVDKADGKERNKPDTAYEFAGGQRTFKDTGKYGGFYKP